MKQLTIDLENKFIEIEGSISVDDLVKFMDEHKFDAKEFHIRSKVISFSNPVYIPSSPSVPQNPYWRDNIIYCVNS